MGSSSPRPRVLVADNDADMRTSTALRLGRAGYDVLTARDGEEALACARAEQPDLCVLDVVMPKLTGYEVTRCLRADARTSDIPVILLTALASDARERFDSGADGYIRKPFSPQELRARVRTLLARG
jgi:DNA-binding response OmpR family regulator